MDDRADVVSVFLCYPIRNRISDMIGFEGLNTARSFVLIHNIVGGLDAEALNIDYRS